MRVDPVMWEIDDALWKFVKFDRGDVNLIVSGEDVKADEQVEAVGHKGR